LAIGVSPLGASCAAAVGYGPALGSFEFAFRLSAKEPKVAIRPHTRKLTVFGLMGWKRKVSGGVLAVVGYMLSPLSWWNDAFVNLPLAYAFAWCVSRFYRPAFGVSMVVGYWLTNVLGLVLMRKGAQEAVTQKRKWYTGREMAIDLFVSLAYTALIVLLLRSQVLKPIEDYLR
jgi:hypothetical protein